MALKYRLTDAEHKALSTERMAMYVQDGDGWRVDVESAEECDRRDLLATRTQLRELKAAKHARDELFGTSDADEQRRRFAQAEQIAAADMTNEQFAAARSAQDATFEARVAEIEGAHAEVCAPILRQIRERRVATEIDAALARGRVRADSLHLLRPHVVEAIRVEGNDPDQPLTISVLGKDRQPRIRPDGTAIGLDDLIAEWRILDASKKICFEPDGNDRNGSGPH
jgi:hypothetical protein